MRGDSMEPRIFDGDYLTLDCTPVDRKDLKKKAIYALIYENTLLIRRVQLINGLVILSADNPLYSSVQLTETEAADKVRIVGRVLDRSGSVS